MAREKVGAVNDGSPCGMLPTNSTPCADSAGKHRQPTELMMETPTAKVISDVPGRPWTVASWFWTNEPFAK